ncbi:MAG: CPBP family intramembrane metalloprotease [Nocardioidaceae bacterium]|nr:CPBP family intramembrane metalloprotease [Nocardioidaceae bacterium]NUS51785.1 CPBP family intramembrane metalloprotease [Nocardioidaceae bacterium]
MTEQYPGPPPGQQPPPVHDYPPPTYYPPRSYQPQPRYPSFPHPEPTPYHQMLRTWTYVWWKPVLGLLICLFGFLFVTTVVFVLVALVAAAFAPGSYLDAFGRSADFSKVTPSSLLGLNLGLASMVLVTWFVIRVLHGMRPRWLTSVVPKMRWRFFATCLGLAVVALIAQVAVGSLLPGTGEDVGDGSLNHFTVSTAASALVILLTTPLQAAGEEYIFRGYTLMAIGSLFPRAQANLGKWVAIVVTAVLFALAHGSQNFPLFFDRLAFGLIAAWLVTKTGGLEAGIALHVLNNFLAFGFALAFGNLGDSLNISEISWWNIVVTVTQSGVYTVLVLWVARRMGLQTKTQPPEPEPGPAPAGEVATA